MKFNGFDPVFNGDSRILILGSFPSVKSRDVAFYYGNPLNRFWSVLSEAFGESLPRSTEEKTRLCLSHGIALWDIVASCSVTGSLDANLRNIQTVDLSRVLEHSPIQKILCNGAAAFRLTTAAYNGDLPVIKLPSTSPANVRFDKTKWFDLLN